MPGKSEKPIAALMAGFLSLVITACGGGGSSPTDTPTPTAPTIATQPNSLIVVAGHPATFSVVASGSATLIYQWKKNDSNIANSNSPIYTIPATSGADNGAIYSVAVSNSLGTVTSNTASLSVLVQPTIATQPSSQSIATGQAASFSVEATGTEPLSYQWMKNGNSIPGATSRTYTTPAIVTGDNGAVFAVVVGNSVGAVTSKNAILSNVAIGKQPSDRTVSTGQRATFVVTATGTGPFTYQWKQDGVNIPNAIFNSYTTPVTASGDNGAVFTVEVSNSTGTVTSSTASLTVLVQPTITTQPSSQSFDTGQAASFSVEATGTEPLSYQWMKNGNSIPGATSRTYTTPPIVTGDNGAVFTVVVSNSAGTVTSSTARLTINELFSLVPKNGGFYEKTECVKDNTTGLVWEGKNPIGSSSRAADTTYTNYDSLDIEPKWVEDIQDYVPITTSDIDAITNSIGYVKSVNASSLCGFTDWRLPTSDELQGIVKMGTSPAIDGAWFPNTQAVPYWSSVADYDNCCAWFVNFYDGVADIDDRGAYRGIFRVRLVR